MPRKAPKEVIEHRITFGDYERKELRDAINAYQGDKIAENIPNYLLAGAGIVAAGGIALAAWALYKWFDIPGEIFQEIKGTTYDIGSAIASFLTGNPLYAAQRAGAKATTEEEVIAAYQPFLDDLNEQILALESTDKPFPNKARILQDMYKTRAQIELLRARDLRRVGDPTGGYSPGRRPIEELAVRRGLVGSLEEAQALTDEELEALFQ